MPLNDPGAPPPAQPQAADTPDHSNRCTFKLTKEDWYACFSIVSKRLADQTRAKTSIWTTNVLPWVFFGMALVTFFHLYEKYPWLGMDFSMVVGFFCIGTLLHITGSSYRRKIQRELIIPDNSIYLDEIRFEALPTGVKLESRGGVSFIRWECHHLLG